MQPETMAGDRVAVERVRVHGMADGREMDPDLVCPPCLEPHAEHRMPCCISEHLEMRDGRLPYARGHEGGIVGVTAEGGVDRPRPGQPIPLHDRPVDAAHAPGRHHLDEPRERWLAFREHHQARCVAVEPVNDARPVWVFPSRYAPVQECVHERTRRVASTGVHHEPGRLIDDQYVLVLEDYWDGNLFRREPLLRNLSFDVLPVSDLVGTRGYFTVDEQ